MRKITLIKTVLTYCATTLFITSLCVAESVQIDIEFETATKKIEEIAIYKGESITILNPKDYSLESVSSRQTRLTVHNLDQQVKAIGLSFDARCGMHLIEPSIDERSKKWPTSSLIKASEGACAIANVPDLPEAQKPGRIIYSSPYKPNGSSRQQQLAVMSLLAQLGVPTSEILALCDSDNECVGAEKCRLNKILSSHSDDFDKSEEDHPNQVAYPGYKRIKVVVIDNGTTWDGQTYCSCGNSSNSKSAMLNQFSEYQPGNGLNF